MRLVLVHGINQEGKSEGCRPECGWNSVWRIPG